MTDLINLIPIMTSFNSPSGIASASTELNNANQAYMAFDDNINTNWFTAANQNSGWIAYEFPTPQNVVKYSIASRNSSLRGDPKSWTFEGSNDDFLTKDILDTQNNVTSWAVGLKKEFPINNNKKYKKYRVNISEKTAVGAVSAITLSEIEMFGSPSIERLLILYNNEYYYKNVNSWINLGVSPTQEQLYSNEMTSIISSEIKEFEQIYGNEWDIVKWTEVEASNSVMLDAIPKPQILPAKNSIQLTGIVSGTFKWTATGGSRVALSVDDGVTYHALKNGVWIDVTNDMSNAMTADEYTAMTWEQYKLLAGDSNFLKHQYYIPDNSEVDDILIVVELMGTNKLSSDYTTSYDQSKKTISINIKKSGTYFANVLDI